MQTTNKETQDLPTSFSHAPLGFGLSVCSSFDAAPEWILFKCTDAFGVSFKHAH